MFNECTIIFDILLLHTKIGKLLDLAKTVWPWLKIKKHPEKLTNWSFQSPYFMLKLTVDSSEKQVTFITVAKSWF